MSSIDLADMKATAEKTTSIPLRKFNTMPFEARHSNAANNLKGPAVMSPIPKGFLPERQASKHISSCS
jgi:hypothetical protein